MDAGHQISQLRRELGLTLEQFAQAIGLQSKGNASTIERTGKCSLKVALAIEGLSSGRIPASSLNDDVAMVDAARAESADTSNSAEAA